jgi:ABC-type nitrate/sulfonate/bicarbonate transport system ATPase subunit
LAFERFPEYHSLENGELVVTIEPNIRVIDISKTFSSDEKEVQALKDISLSVSHGTFICIVGPSGCGKSTLFNIMTGLLQPDTGHVYLDGEEITGKTGIVGYMPQKDLLFPWRTVLENSILGLELKGVSHKEAVDQAIDLFKVFGLSGFENFYPSALSGGMKQRVSLARTFLFDTKVMLLDEPFGALDALSRGVMQEWLLEVWDQIKATIFFITHDVEEAVFLADRILVLSARPATILADIEVPLSRPRSISQRTSAEALAIRQSILGYLEGETQKAFSQQAVTMSQSSKVKIDTNI